MDNGINACGQRHHPPRALCDACGSRGMETGVMADTGKVLTFTVTRTAPAGFALDIPYVVAILEMDDGTRIMAQVADVRPDEVAIGMSVRLEFRRIQQCGKGGVIAYGHKAVPA